MQIFGSNEGATQPMIRGYVRHFRDGDPPNGDVSSIAPLPRKAHAPGRLRQDHRFYTSLGRLLAK